MLTRPVRPRVVASYTGRLAMVWSVLVAVPAGFAFYTGQHAAGASYASIAIAAAVGGLALSRIRAPRRVRPNEAMVIGSALFVVSPLAMTVPLAVLGLPVLDALFESISGVTTTGLSTLPSVENEPALFLFVRSWTQWYGGLGIVGLALALVTRPGALARRLSFAEGYKEEGLGSTRAHFRSVVAVYVAITVLGVGALWLAGVGWFSATVYSLAAVSTGGFSPHDASLAGLDDRSLDAVVIALCVAGAIPFALYVRALRGKWREVVADAQVRALLWAGVAATAVVGVSMWAVGGLSFGDVASHAPVLALSAQTTAGFTSLDVATLDDGSKLVMMGLMAVGGGAGSTAGGVKLLRALIVLRLVQVMFTRLRLPRHAVLEPRLGGNRIDRDEVQEAVTIIALFAATVLVSWLCFVAAGYDPIDSLFEVTSATGTVGLSTGIAGPDLPAVLKLVLCADMLLGRLEFIALLVVVSPHTWLSREGRQS